MIYLTGDIHGNYDISKLNSTMFPESHLLTKDDYVVILGDFGIIWEAEESKSERYWLDWLDNKPWTTLFIDGNHENFNRLNKFPEIDMFGNKVGNISKSIFHLKRGRIYNIDNNNIFCFGGGLSVDKHYRIENISWWKEEYPSEEEMNLALINLEKYNYKVDYVFTHTAPLTFFNRILNETDFRGINIQNRFKSQDAVSIFLDNILYDMSFKHWYFGHYHDEYYFNKFTCLYDDIIKLSSKE